MSTPAAIVALLREASKAYYNGGTAVMGDENYDALLEKLKELDPENPYLDEVGAPPPEAGAVSLPFPMPSLDKIKPGQDTLTRFLATGAEKGLVVSAKLDGLSALWIPRTRKLYLRGDGLVGLDLSNLVEKGLTTGLPCGGSEVVRGELILSRAAAKRIGTEQPRAWVNGLVHRKDAVAEDLRAVEFLAYELLSPAGLKRNDQFDELVTRGYKTPHIATFPSSSEESLSVMLKKAREIYLYDVDGLVVGWNTVPKSESTATRARNPKDCVAFKMPLADQSAETTVREVLWAASAQGYLIPRLQFDPVRIAAATIEFCTGHNARTVVAAGLGPGARIVIRRSGDVIPALERVVAPAPGGASLPPADSCEWDGPAETATHLKVTTETDAMIATRLQHFLKTLDIPGSGPATATALVAGGIRGPAALWAASAARLSELLGPKTGAGLHENLRTALGKVTEKELMLASSRMPRGVGDTKLSSLFAREADPRKWHRRVGMGCEAPAGWTLPSFGAFLTEFPKYEEWRRSELSFLPYPVVPGVPVAPAAAAAPAAPTATPQVICMTGFRDKDLETRATAAGHTFGASVTGKTTVLLVPDGEVRESEKVKGARARGVQIMTRSAFVAKYLP